LVGNRDDLQFIQELYKVHKKKFGKIYLGDLIDYLTKLNEKGKGTFNFKVIRGVDTSRVQNKQSFRRRSDDSFDMDPRIFICVREKKGVVFGYKVIYPENYKEII